MVVKNQRALLRRLKKQVRMLKRKAERSQNKMRTALVKVKKVAKAFKIKLAMKERTAKAKIAAVRAEVYQKVAVDVERQIKRKSAAKEKAVRSMVAKVEKAFVSKLAKAIKKKGKKSAKRKAKKSEPRKVKGIRSRSR